MLDFRLLADDLLYELAPPWFSSDSGLDAGSWIDRGVLSTLGGLEKVSKDGRKRLDHPVARIHRLAWVNQARAREFQATPLSGSPILSDDDSKYEEDMVVSSFIRVLDYKVLGSPKIPLVSKVFIPYPKWMILSSGMYNEYKIPVSHTRTRRGGRIDKQVYLPKRASLIQFHRLALSTSTTPPTGSYTDEYLASKENRVEQWYYSKPVTGKVEERGQVLTGVFKTQSETLAYNSSYPIEQSSNNRSEGDYPAAVSSRLFQVGGKVSPAGLHTRIDPSKFNLNQAFKNNLRSIVRRYSSGTVPIGYGSRLWNGVEVGFRPAQDVQGNWFSNWINLSHINLEEDSSLEQATADSTLRNPRNYRTIYGDTGPRISTNLARGLHQIVFSSGDIDLVEGHTEQNFPDRRFPMEDLGRFNYVWFVTGYMVGNMLAIQAMPLMETKNSMECFNVLVDENFVGMGILSAPKTEILDSRFTYSDNDNKYDPLKIIGFGIRQSNLNNEFAGLFPDKNLVEGWQTNSVPNPFVDPDFRSSEYHDIRSKDIYADLTKRIYRRVLVRADH